MIQKVHNKTNLKDYRKELRNNSTSAEATLWKSLRKKQIEGRKFRRQHSIKNYIVDFYCPEEKLIIELDGAEHLEFAKQNYDQERDSDLKNLGYKILRFENKYVFEDLETVLSSIKNSFR